MSYCVFDIAEKIVAKTNIDCGDNISNLKLQKLLYYMQGFHLAIFNEPLFEDEIEAWMYGPVVPSVYAKYSEYGYNAISIKNLNAIVNLTESEENIFEQVYAEYGQFSALKLMEMTHAERPWRITPQERGSVIAKDVIRSYFMTQIEDDGEQED